MTLTKMLKLMLPSEFFAEIHSEFYPEINVDFMVYFLYIIREKGFVIPHNKLVEYGISTDNESANMLKRFKRLGLVEDVDYELREVTVIRENRGPVTKNVYYLKTYAFKVCLMKANKLKGNPADPMDYIKFYLLLETMHDLHETYRRTFEKKKRDKLRSKIKNLKSEKDDLSSKIDDLLESNKEQTAKMDEQKAMIDELLGHSRDSKTKIEKISTELTVVNTKVQETNGIVQRMQVGFNKFTSFVRSNMPACFRNTRAEATKSYMSNLQENNSIRRMKIQYLVVSIHRGKTMVCLRCTNVDGIHKSLANIDGRIISVTACNINLNEINTEYKNLKDIDPVLSSRRPKEYDGDINVLVDSIRKSHLSRFEEENTVTEYIKSQDIEYNDSMAICVQELLQLFVARGYANRPSKREVDEKLQMIYENSLRDLGNDTTMDELIRENGEEEIASQIGRIIELSD